MDGWPMFWTSLSLALLLALRAPLASEAATCLVSPTVAMARARQSRPGRWPRSMTWCGGGCDAPAGRRLPLNWSHIVIDGLTVKDPGGRFIYAGGASHTCLVLMGVQRSAVRGNRFENSIQKLMEVFTTRQREVGDEVRKSEYLVIEDNHFGPAPQIEVNGTNNGSGSAGIQYAGDGSILRRSMIAVGQRATGAAPGSGPRRLRTRCSPTTSST